MLFLRTLVGLAALLVSLRPPTSPSFRCGGARDRSGGLTRGPRRGGKRRTTGADGAGTDQSVRPDTVRGQRRWPQRPQSRPAARSWAELIPWEARGGREGSDEGERNGPEVKTVVVVGALLHSPPARLDQLTVLSEPHPSIFSSFAADTSKRLSHHSLIPEVTPRRSHLLTRSTTISIKCSQRNGGLPEIQPHRIGKK
ncbi:hypothetical protein BDK51DRAFT_49989 [Blyttiomyces helicus]|uniref:Secreted protein n=1 Tax=Blyttiomyces helicus TaxID=388810 RepID=A0A4P9VUY5_9FUNG|nr:hypothetical protein BDK51DRAFT_49989 [Blyttiomyces helicus]|eukprot:RKO83414.1 hypothetical protein BDK51DRAFT_49989 [Blyttiomyces helicus]